MSTTLRHKRQLRKSKSKKNLNKSRIINTLSVVIACAFVYVAFFGPNTVSIDTFGTIDAHTSIQKTTLDKTTYNARMLALARGVAYAPFKAVFSSIASTSSTSSLKSRAPVVSARQNTNTQLWPPYAVYPKYGAIFPFKRVVAYYGNFYSKNMGVLGEYPKKEMLAKLERAVKAWTVADPTTSVVPAIDYIAITAQGSSGSDGMYRARMPDSQIEKALSISREVHGVLILDVQVGLSTLENELPLLKKYLKQPDVELAIDPEFSMSKSKIPPGRIIGTVDAKDINYAIEYLAKLVRTYHLPPKFLVVHRFTEAMVTNYKKIVPLPEVQVVMDMDGWGSPSRKRRTYKDVIYKEPIQFTGFKLFYKNDIRPPSDHLMTPKEVLQLIPRPIFIQYQ